MWGGGGEVKIGQRCGGEGIGERCGEGGGDPLTALRSMYKNSVLKLIEEKNICPAKILCFFLK